MNFKNFVVFFLTGQEFPLSPKVKKLASVEILMEMPLMEKVILIIIGSCREVPLKKYNINFEIQKNENANTAEEKNR